MALPKSFTTVTPFSKYLAMALFVIFPFVSFYLGMQYEKLITPNYPSTGYAPPLHPPHIWQLPTASPQPSCRPRPKCLDVTPKCMIPETADMCPPTIPPKKNKVFCSMEAKLCPNGSYVGRSGPNCEFAPCPQK